MSMNLALLRAFHRVAQAGSFTRAAAAAGVSQPTLSAQVRALEDRYEAGLFDRHRRRVALTPLGQALLEVTSRLFAAEEEAEALLGGARSLTRGHLRVASDSAAHVMPLLASLRHRHPGLTFSLLSGNSSEVLELLLSFRADIGIAARQISDPRLFSREIRTDLVVLFVPPTHPWARLGSVRIDQLATADLVIRERGSTTREVFETELAAAGVRPRSLIEVQTREAVREAVVAGFGVGIVFESEVGVDVGVRPVRIEAAELAVREYLVCLEERRRLPLVRRLFEIAGASV